MIKAITKEMTKAGLDAFNLTELRTQSREDDVRDIYSAMDAARVDDLNELDILRRRIFEWECWSGEIKVAVIDIVRTTADRNDLESRLTRALASDHPCDL